MESKIYTEHDCKHPLENNPVKPDHYDMPITPIEYIERNGLGFSEGNVVKYVSRHLRRTERRTFARLYNIAN